MKAYLIDKNGKNTGVVEANDWRDFQKLVDCDVFDIVTRDIGGKYYDIYCDDEGLLKGSPIATGYRNIGTAESPQYEPMLVGNLVISQSDEEGETIALTDDDIENIEANMLLAMRYDMVKGGNIGFNVIKVNY